MARKKNEQPPTTAPITPFANIEELNYYYYLPCFVSVVIEERVLSLDLGEGEPADLEAVAEGPQHLVHAEEEGLHVPAERV